jgi:hypothetical protein
MGAEGAGRVIGAFGGPARGTVAATGERALQPGERE